MIQFFVYGISYKNCPVEIREALHFREQKLSEALRWLRQEWPSAEALILSTCNRVELYFAIEKSEPDEGFVFSSEMIANFLASFHGLDSRQFEKHAYQWEGRKAVEHLFRVASGLDSMVVGENEILGQLKEAFRAAQDSGAVDSFLHRCVERALRVGKRIRTETKINEGAVSVPSVAVELAEKIFGHLSGKKIMVLGTGQMSELTLQNLRQAGGEALYVVSRSEERGRLVAESHGARWVSRENWEKLLIEIDVLIASTSAPHPLVTDPSVRRVMDKRRHRPLFLIDIAVPRNIEPAVHSLDDVYLYNIDDLQEVAQSNLRLRRREIEEAERHVERAVDEFLAWTEKLQAAPTIQLLQASLDGLIEEEMENMHFSSEEEKEKFRNFSKRLRSKFMHAPLEALKESSRTGTLRRTLEALHTLFLSGKTGESRFHVQDRNARK